MGGTGRRLEGRTSQSIYPCFCFQRSFQLWLLVLQVLALVMHILPGALSPRDGGSLLLLLISELLHHPPFGL